MRALRRHHGRVPGDLPYMAVRILEITRIPAPKRFLGSLGNRRPSPLRGSHERIDLTTAGDIMANRETGRAERCFFDPGIVLDVVLRP